MKLLSLTLFNEFRSFQPFDKVEFYNPSPHEKVDAICLVGLNGSGKSQLIELLAEIFYFLDTYFLYKKNNQTKTPKFEIEYVLRLDEEDIKVRVSNTKSIKKPDFTITKEEIETIIKDEVLQKKYLPTKIIGYSSGLNETLSIPFADIMQMYSQKVSNEGLQLQSKPVETPRMLNVDYETNSLILIANYLLNENGKLKQFEENIRIKRLEFFRLVIQLKHKAAPPKGIKITKELENYLEWFKNSATCYDYDKRTESYKLDFVVDDATKKAFKFYFETPEKLFMAFYKFYLLNPIIIGNDYKKYLANQRNNKILTKPPYTKAEDRVFRFDEIKLRITKPNRIIDYIGVSDGEHQYVNTFGSVMLFDQDNVLYLFDEAETHFNPQWRSKFISILNNVVTSPNQDFVISTHSPFIISDCRGHNVYKFKRNEDGVVTFEPIGFETYGASFENILKEGFDIGSISEKSRIELEKLLEITDPKKIQYLEEMLDKFGKSIKTFFLIEHIDELKEKSNN